MLNDFFFTLLAKELCSKDQYKAKQVERLNQSDSVNQKFDRHIIKRKVDENNNILTLDNKGI